LEIQTTKNIEDLLACDLLIDGLFGFGLEREITGKLADLIKLINQAKKTVISIDLPSGIHTDTGAVMGQAIQATESLCLGLWKRAYFQDQAISYLGRITKLNFGVPRQSLEHTLINQTDNQPIIQSFTKELAQSYLPLQRSPLVHKYQQGHLLLIGGSQTYAGSILLAALGARATGIGMLTIVVPESLKLMVVAQIPEALVIGCPETETGAIQALPNLDLTRYQAIACGCGLTVAGAKNILPELITATTPLILDADALNWLAQDNLQGNLKFIQNRQNSTILTPHLGEFKRLFPGIQNTGDRLNMNQQAAQLSDAIILLKGAKSVITQPNGDSYCLMESTPALARGGSGDVLLGVMGGLLAQSSNGALEIAATAAWWHAQAGILAAQEQTLAGVDGVTLSMYLSKYLSKYLLQF
jgi:NAD(P)H-hydrate epimerase